MKRMLQRVVLIVPAFLLAQSWAAAQVNLPGQDSPFGGPSQALTWRTAVQKVEARIEPATAKRGQAVRLKVTVELAPGTHTYPFHQEDPKAASDITEIKLAASDGLIPVGRWTEPTPASKAEPELGIKKLQYFEGAVVWERDLVVSREAKPGPRQVQATATLIVCDASNCLPPHSVPVQAQLTVSDAPAVAVDARYQAEVDRAMASARNQVEPSRGSAPASGQPVASAEDGAPSGAQQAANADVLAMLQPGTALGGAASDRGLLAFVLAGVFWGAVSLITPCVFPMIPITVSFFLKQSEKENHRPLTMALVYCLTIVAVLTVAAVAFLSFFRALSVNPVMNFALGGLFVFFALSLFGMYDIELPSGLARYTSAREGQGGMLGTVFMALTFTIVSFACVAPFLGGFGGTAANAQMTWLQRVLGGLAFSATFAAPFFVLALFPTLLKKMPKSGSWLNTVKVVMGFLELAAALKFLRAGELVLLPQPALFTYDLVLGVWIGLALLCGLYLLNLYRLPNDTPLDHLSVPRLLFSLAFLGLSFYLMPALFKFTANGENQRPNGVVYAWVDSFLLPEAQPNSGGLAWTGDLKQAVTEAAAYAKRTGKPKFVFIDFTGETCTNCKLNERTVFSKPDVQKLFQPFERVKLFTDKVPDDLYPPEVRARLGSGVSRQRADAAANLWFQRKAFNTEQLPLYVILEPLPTGKVAVRGVYAEGRIQNENAFVQFLKEPFEGPAKQTAQVVRR